MKKSNIMKTRELFDGHYLESYIAYSDDPEIRKNSTSGELITTLITELIKNKEFDGGYYVFKINDG